MAKIKIKSVFSSSHKRITALVTLLAVFVYLVLALIFKLWPLEKHVTINVSSVKDSLPSHSDTSTNSPSTDNTSQAMNDNPKQPSQINSNTQSLTAPSGTFVNLYDADANTQMNSICNTTPGATCQVVFTHGNISVALPAKTADSGGAATWAWTPQQLHLTSGKWHITAKATLGSQTKTTDNGSLELVIQ